MLPAEPRFLIARLSALGDCIHSLPMACALRRHFPRARITWVVEAGTAPLLEGHPAIDRLVVAPRGWLRVPSQVWRLREQLQAETYDVALDPQSLTKSAMAAWLSGAPRRIGFGGAHGRELSTWINTELVEAESAHIVERYLELLRPLGVAAPQVEFDLPEPEAAARMAERFIAAAHLRCGFGVVNPGAGWRSKLWLPEFYGRVVKHMGQTHGLPSAVVWAGEQELAWARQVVHHSGGHALLAPPTSLTELAAVVRRARLFLGSDTGPLHLAAAVGTTCVGLYGPTRAEECAPYGLGNFTVQEYYQDGTCRQRRTADNRAMVAIVPERVFEACDRALARRRPDPGKPSSRVPPRRKVAA